MHELITIIRKEIKVAIREKVIIAMGVIVMILLGISLYAGYVTNNQQTQSIRQAQAEKHQEWLNQGDKHPHIAAHYGMYVFKPKTILSLFDFGLDAYTGTSVYLEAHYQHEFMFRPAQDHSSMIRFGELSSALVLQVLMPLLIIFMTFSSFTRERESGTLKLLMSQGVSHGKLIWGKVLAQQIMLILILVPFIVGLFLLPDQSNSEKVLPDMLSRVFLLALIYLLYLFFFIALSVWVSLRSATGRNALLSLLVCWIFFVILFPKTVVNLSESFYSLPSMREFKAGIEADKLTGLEGSSSRSVRMTMLEEEYLKKYEVDSIQQLPINFEGIMMQAGEEYGNEIYDHHLESLRQIFYKQGQLSSVASLFNPFLALQHISMALSGSDLHTFIHFEETVENYRRTLVKKMNNDMAENSRYGEFFEYKAGRDLWDQVSSFEYQTPKAAEVLRHYYLEIFSLFMWVCIATMLLSFATKKMRING